MKRTLPEKKTKIAGPEKRASPTFHRDVAKQLFIQLRPTKITWCHRGRIYKDLANDFVVDRLHGLLIDDDDFTAVDGLAAGTQSYFVRRVRRILDASLQQRRRTDRSHDRRCTDRASTHNQSRFAEAVTGEKCFLPKTTASELFCKAPQCLHADSLGAHKRDSQTRQIESLELFV